MAVVPLINHLVGNDKMVLGVDGDLYIVADGGGCWTASPRQNPARTMASAPLGSSGATFEPTFDMASKTQPRFRPISIKRCVSDEPTLSGSVAAV
jgi:hypothetical protein